MLTVHPHLQPRSTRPSLFYNTRSGQNAARLAILRDAVPLTFFLGLGAFIQYLFGALVPRPSYTPLVALPLLLLIAPWIKPTLQSFGLARNPHQEAVVLGKMHARMPGGEEDEEGVLQSPEFGLLLIGAKNNNPFGRLNARSKAIGLAFNKVSRSSDDRPGLWSYI
jgi:hypothetical protein